MINLLHGDCLIESDKIQSGSVDLILTDLPYGNMNTDGGRKLGINGWDLIIEPKKVFEIANRILRKNGKMVLFSQEPYTTQLINEAIPNVPFNYRAIWEKDNFAIALGANKNMVGFYEDILVFSKSEDIIINPIKEYTNKIRKFINKKNYDIYNDFEKAGFKKYAILDTFNSDNARRYNFPTLETYNNLINLYSIDKMKGFVTYESAFKMYRDFENKTLSTFNLWEGNKYKSNILKYKKDYNRYHPTQKPVLLLEDLIKTFTNENNLVVDLTMGSGSTGVACQNTNRSFIGIEKDDKYFELAKNRIENHIVVKQLF
jgi:site-specific DNA-methyltransferase (adenine-specific)